MNREKTVSLCMIVKNEENYLTECLNSVKGIIDEIILVDTGSTDNTLLIGESFGAKIFHYQWDNNFANARNFSISKASSDWILLLDGDEIFDRNYLDDFIQLINESPYDGYLFTIYNYTGHLKDKDFSIHHAFRLLKNHKGYTFKGAIHEQIVSSDQQVTSLPFEASPIVIHHYGYLIDVVAEKDKRARNIPIIEEQLKDDPENAFYLFNLGNEYLAAHQLEKAFEIYSLSRQHLSKNPAFAPYLYYRMIICCTILKRNEEAILLADEILTQYPSFTDIVYCKGILFFNMHQYTMALDTFDQCIKMGPSPLLLTFLDGCSTYKPYLMKADIYRRLNDLDRAIYCFSQSFYLDKKTPQVLYDIAALLHKKHKEEKKTAEELAHYLSDSLPDSVLYIDILISEQLYETANELLQQLSRTHPSSVEILFLRGKLHFYLQENPLAIDCFQQVLDISCTSEILKDIDLESLKYLFTLNLMEQQDKLDSLIQQIETKGTPNLLKIYQEIYNLHLDKKDTLFTEEDDPGIYLPLIFDFLDKLLKIKSFDLFEKYVYLLNRLETNVVLLELARLYEKNGYQEMARKTFIKSLRDLDVIDIRSLDFLATMY
ncbi:TPR domain-containing glycosyltransferase [Anaeromicropila populeti]|uniref:Glycosyltransferase involved in cell wall bisynthesis n=1 Tax=Anaeromicropila populeti TaxID=37658 RepID=A0A1I6HXY2_9FIRM|nr:TPR domain-containing glycosyltransferase [Anaeromicropila populeti]SFR59264.1 Glycosyltransferase involved in cell wall bisynthesis [Anaeromicropila populeti]